MVTLVDRTLSEEDGMILGRNKMAKGNGITTLNFASVPKNEPLEEGTYEFLIKKVEDKVSKTSGNPMWLVTFEEVESKSVVWENYTFVEKALFKLKELFDALGYVTDTENFELPDKSEIEGNFVKGKVIQDEYNGSITNRIKKLFV